MVLYRSIKVFVFLVVTLSQSIISTQAQVVQTLLFVEDFDTVNNISFSTAMGTPKYGNNEWFINNEYNGNGQYPNTISQSITLGNIGKIGYANGRYLHVRDMNATLASNACFNPLNNSERWAVMNNGVCTFGFDVIGLNFWWTCEGSSKSYGEVYYSIDGGTTWILTKNTDNLTKYKNMPVWKYTVVEDSAFLDQLDLRFAFKWTNVGASSGEKGPFSVDDIMIVATTNPLPPTNITAVFATPNPICQEQVGGIRFFFNVSDDLCPYNVFIVEFADSAGSFANATPISAYGTTNVFGLTTTVPMTAGLWVSPPMGPIHTNIPIGGCYKWRVRMITPPFAGAIVSTGCIQVIDCIDSIVTMEAAVLKYPQNPGCRSANSVIDVPFFSYGAFQPGNDYVLQLSDSSGSFASPTQIGGPMPSTQTYDPAIYPPPTTPGSMSGKIPVVPAGCNYYIRVASTDPNLPDSLLIPWGPFCIEHCDITTNLTIDITLSACTLSIDTCIPCDIHSFTNNAIYKPGNQFIAQVLDATTMAVVNNGGLGVLIDTVGGKLCLHVPDLAGYVALGLEPGKMYYFRIVSTDSATLGTIIRFTVYLISGAPLTITGPPTVMCGNSDVLIFDVNTKTPSSSYIWTFPGIGSTNPIPANQHPIGITGAIFGSGTHTVEVREVNGPCIGPPGTFTFTVNGPPSVDIQGDLNVCVGDTVTYTVTFFDATYYNWDYSGGTLIDSANNEITVYWNKVGNGSISLRALGFCGEDYSIVPVVVLPRTDAIALPQDTSICSGGSITFTARNATIAYNNQFIWSIDGIGVIEDTTLSGLDTIHSFTVYPDSSTQYIVEINFFGCSDYDTVNVEVFGVYLDDNLTLCKGDSVQLTPFYNGGETYTWVPEYALNDPNSPTPMASPEISTTYRLVATFNNGCDPDTADVTINVIPTSFSIANDEFIILRGDKIQLNTSGGGTYLWTPSNGLSDTTIANPIANPDSTTTYTVIIDDGKGCKTQYDVTIVVVDINIKVPNAFTPNGDNENDILYAINFGIDEFLRFNIYNRWGEAVFETEDISTGWDGMYKSVPQEVGTYVWYIKAKDVMGNIRELHGDVTLLR